MVAMEHLVVVEGGRDAGGRPQAHLVGVLRQGAADGQKLMPEAPVDQGGTGVHGGDLDVKVKMIRWTYHT